MAKSCFNSPHPNLLGNCSMRSSTSCIHAVVPAGEGMIGLNLTALVPQRVWTELIYLAPP